MVGLLDFNITKSLEFNILSCFTDPDNVFVETFTVIHGIEKQSIIVPCKPTSKYVTVELLKDDEEVSLSFNIVKSVISCSPSCLSCYSTMLSVSIIRYQKGLLGEGYQDPSQIEVSLHAPGWSYG